MNNSFDDIVEARISKIQDTLRVKAKEYTVGGNRFHNFDVAARIANTTPEQALWDMMLKHFVSIMDLVDATSVDPNRIDPCVVDEKLGDMINYLILLEGLLCRRLDTKKEV